jgi:hypothetical protein
MKASIEQRKRQFPETTVNIDFMRAAGSSNSSMSCVGWKGREKDTEKRRKEWRKRNKKKEIKNKEK